MSQQDVTHPDHAPNDDENPLTENPAEGNHGADAADALLSLTVLLPHAPHKLPIMVAPHEQVHDVRQSVIDLPAAFQYTCCHLEHAGERINDFLPICEVPGLGQNSEIRLVEDPYTEREARMHVVRMRELIGAAGDRTDTVQGVLPGFSVFEKVAAATKASTGANGHQSPPEYNFSSPADISILLPGLPEDVPKTVKSIALSSWNPPPSHLRQKGHLLYLVITTNEGEQHQITAHVGGFYVNKSSNSKFDPFPRHPPKGHAAHSLLTLIEAISPSFAASFLDLQEHNNEKDPLASFQITSAMPATPWLVPEPTSALCAHSSDATRSQESYLIAGESAEMLRDWNEEFQSAKELPKGNVQDRVFRERLMSKLFADYNDAAVKGAMLVVRGEVAPLNPTEDRDAQIFVYNNIFFSFSSDGMGTFASVGGEHAARVAAGKDVAGVRLVYQLDIDGLFSPATAVIDYMGQRVVCQSIVPGIFRQRDPGENQIDYGGVDGKDVVSVDERFVQVFAQLSRAVKVKKHPVWDKDGKRFDLEASVETKGLMGTDGRKYILDLYRITPLDIVWIEEHTDDEGSGEVEYPHRMAVLRPELVEAFGRRKMKEWMDGELARHDQARKEMEKIHAEALVEGEPATSEGQNTGSDVPKNASDAEKNPVDASSFHFSLNPDVFSGQVPHTESEKKELEHDEQEVRRVCEYLCNHVIPGLIRELSESDVGFPMDGRSLGHLLHKRGINLRYMGRIANLCEDTRLSSLQEICVQEMVARSFKHIASSYLHHLPNPLTPACFSHLLNCLLGQELNAQPAADIDPMMRALYPQADLAFADVTPVGLKEAIEKETLMRYRYKLHADWQAHVKPLQLLREVSYKLGIQLRARKFLFSPESDDPPEVVAAAGPTISTLRPANGQPNGDGKKKRKKARDGSPASMSSINPPCTFSPDDIVNIVPVLKHSCPRSVLAEEALEAGRLSILQGQRKLGQELLLESLSLHEQIYGVLHPEVAKAYSSLSMLYYQLDEKEAAVDLARKATIIAERTIGIDSVEALLDYLNLSLFLYQSGESDVALAYAKHALELWKIIYGPDHPDSITTINNGAVMLQHMKAYHESRLWFEESLRICEKVYGKQSVNSATLLFQLAQALAVDHDAKAAVNRMRESYNSFLSKLGPADKNTKEAESWLEQLTQNAVSIAKHAKDVQARRMRAGIRFTPRATTLAATPEVKTATEVRPSQIDSRSIDELMRYIEGGEAKQVKAPKARPGQENPKRRGKSSAS